MFRNYSYGFALVLVFLIIFYLVVFLLNGEYYEWGGGGGEIDQKVSVLHGKYELGRVLGHGTFANVYLAKNLETGQNLAIKVVNKKKVIQVGMMEQVKREISIMKMLKHPNIVELYEVLASKTRIYFAMEYVKGGELFNKISNGKLEEDVGRSYFQQLISAVDYCHSRGVFHRDLKPENILLDEDGNVKVTDFGLSALSEQMRQDGLLHTSCGTPAYVAPEVIGRRGYDGAKADIWSCGVILFVMLAGFLPFRDDNLVGIYRKIYTADFKCPPWMSSEARKLISKLLDPNPNTRMTMSKLMQTSWFKKKLVNMEEDEEEDFDVDKQPETLNAFHLISFSKGFNLSGLFERENNEENEEFRFTTTKPASEVVMKLEEVAKAMKFNVKKSDSMVTLIAHKKGRYGEMGIAAEFYSVASSFLIVEVKKERGDTMEYIDFCRKELQPVLKDIGWISSDEGKATN